MTSNKSHTEQVRINIEKLSQNSALKKLSNEFLRDSSRNNYSYNFSWMGRPIIQYPQDIVAIQELIWRVKPELIIETGIAHGGSLVLSASILALIDMSEAIQTGGYFDSTKSKRKVYGIDIDIRPNNKKSIEEHPLSSYIKMVEGSSIAHEVVAQVHEFAKSYKTVMVILDSNHTHDHVLEELKCYAPLVSVDSYCIVFDSSIEDMPKDLFPNRPWGPGNNPKTAIWEYLKTHPEFVNDRDVENKLLISVAPDGYLKRVK